MTRYSGNIVKAQLPGASVAGASGAWELEDAAQQIGSGAWPAAVGLNDPNFYQNALLLNGDGTNGATNSTFVDGSTNNFTITRNGNATQGSFTPYGGANYSAYFDGNGDYLGVTTSSSTTIGTSSATVEFWMYATANDGYRRIITSTSGAFGSGSFCIRFDNGAFTAGARGATYVTSSLQPAANQWYHVAWVGVNGTSQTLYINGVSVGTAGSYNFTEAISFLGGYYSTGPAEFFVGFLSNVRVVKGSAVYTANFTPSTAPLNTTSNTSLLTCASQSFEDLSASSLAITRNGDTRITESSPFNSYNRTPVSYGAYFDGSGDYLTAPAGTQFQFTGDYTVEYWVYLTSVAGVQDFVGNYVSSASPDWTIILNGSKIQYYPSSAASFVESGVVAANTWYHVAAVRSGSTCSLYVNGVSVGTPLSFSGTLGDATRPIYISSRTGGSNYLNGAISNLRIVKGTALYTANFTPPTAPLTAVSGTSLLTCQDSTFKDNSSNAYAITLLGNTRPIKANPFNYTIALGTGYNAATMGGSAYFDGTGDFLNFTGGTATSLNADFTIEGWLYANSFAVTQIILCIGDDFANPGVAFYVGTDGKLGIFYGNARALTGTTVAAANTWHHVAFVRSGSTITGYLNGVPQGTVTNSSTFSGTTTYIGGELYNGTAGGRNNGYVAGLRLVKGTALYTGPFVPPQSPVTAVTNTQLLLNFANGGIVDYATGTTFETVSGAKISTTTKKYGTGSIAFNGSTDYLRAPFNPNLNFGTGNFTVECWVYVASSANSDQTIIASNQAWGSGAVLVKAYQTGNVSFSAYDYNSGGTAMVASPATLNTWVHVALVRNGNTFTLYLNGTSAATQTSTIAVNFAPTNGTYIGHAGAINPTTGYLNGYIDDLRISRYARYTANFTPPSALQIF